MALPSTFLVAGASHLCQLDLKTGQTVHVTPAAAASRRRYYTMRHAETNERDDHLRACSASSRAPPPQHSRTPYKD
jgi:hypothetical protein